MFKILFFVLISIHATAAVKPTSEIPEKREFPVNEKINPCDDFYKYTCSKAIAGFKLRDDRVRHIFSFSDSDERLLEKKKTYLAGLPQQKVKTSGEVELSDIFSSCMNVEQRALSEKKEVERIVAEVYKIKTRKEFQKFLGAKIGSGEFSFLDFGTITNQKNPLKNDIFIAGDLRGLPEKSYYADKKTVSAYKNLVKDFFNTIGLKGAAARASLVVKFEKEFDETYPTPKEWRIIWSKPTKISRVDLLNNFKEFELDEFFKQVPKKTHIRNFTPENFKFLKEALASKRLDQLKSVYLFHALSGSMDEGYKSFYKKKFAFNKKFLGGPKKRPELSERCTNYVKSSFMKELDYELYDKIFGEFSKEKFLGLVKKIRNSLIKSLKENTWLSAKGKKNAIKKMKKAFMQVVKPNNKKEWDFIPAGDYAPDNFLANKKLRTKLYNKKELRSLKERNNNKVWAWGPLMVNAYYSPSQNKFVMPVGILQYPFYDQSLPDHMNLGAIGMVIGHELGHGVDDQGSKYDYKGRLRTWMSKEDLSEFKKRGDQLVAQFEAIKHDGKLTLGENIGDLVGLTTAYGAAFPGDKGSVKDKQDFFVQFGRSWCGVMRPGARKRRLKTDSHSLPEARVNEQVKHQPGFEKAFSCKPDDKLVLSKDKRVKIW